MTSLLNLLSRALTADGVVALPVALVGGCIAALNPCNLPLYPAAAATCCGVRRSEADCCGVQQATATVRRSLANSGAFVVGMAVAMALLGIVAALAGRIAVTALWLRYVIAIVPLVMGLHVLGWVRLPLPSFSISESKLRMTGAFGVGFLLSLVLVPCSTPVLAAVLSFAALKGNLSFGALLLFAYGLGAGIPPLVAATASSRFAEWLDLRGLRKWVDGATGTLLLGLGFYLLWIA